MSVLNVKSTGSKVKTNLRWIDHIWAHNGVVYWRNREGREGHLNPDEALELANRINQDFINVQANREKTMLTRQRVRDELVEKLINAVRAAMRQREQPKDEVERRLSLSFRGLNREGKKITAGNVFNDSILVHYCETYPYLKKDDVVAILKSDRLSPAQASKILELENRKRAIESKDPSAIASSII